MAFPRNFIRAFLVVALFVFVGVSFILLSVKLGRGGMFISYWYVNLPIFLAYAIGLVWLGIEFFFLTDVLSARLKIGAVWTMLAFSLPSLIMLIVRFERLRNISFWICLLPLYIGFSAACLMLVIAIYKTKDLIYDKNSETFYYTREEKIK